MTTDIHDKAAVEQKLWSEITHTRFGMLALTGPACDHFQPMTAFAEPESGTLWFYTHNDSDLALGAAHGTRATFVFMSKDGELQASIHGELRAGPDPLHREKFWTAAVAAWFPKGRNDPHLTMLSFACADAQVWISEAGPLKFGWEIAKANLTGATPALGGATRLKLG